MEFNIHFKRQIPKPICFHPEHKPKVKHCVECLKFMTQYYTPEESLELIKQLIENFKCPVCKGRGNVLKVKCGVCHGSGQDNEKLIEVVKMACPEIDKLERKYANYYTQSYSPWVKSNYKLKPKPFMTFITYYLKEQK